MTRKEARHVVTSNLIIAVATLCIALATLVLVILYGVSPQ